ncbi:spermatogenesis-associated protein 7 homolog [Pungitius pungitius]|uniref:spermatogenesis-associated protein 7 homolog n=1 Tax=Pungitius pungitius TaxID=134920 RepID=UPI0018883C06|nr:spermatogenesis-associated protein 7 homolog [Pungitius pungitius]
MGYDEDNNTMESRIGSVSSGSGCSLGGKGQNLKTSPFCTRSSSKLTQSLVRDHMVSHYKKVYSAKAAIDASVPKSLIHSVKYNDQIRQERLRKGGRPQSAHSLSQRNSRASCSSAQSRLSVQYDDSPYLCSRSSTVSSPRFLSSFNAKDIVYPSFKVGSQNQSHHVRPASERKYRSPEATSHRKQSVCSLGASGDQSYKTFQDPVQKTYSGDLLHKHSQHFTHDKPFTPKTLKSEKSSYLSQYRYYRAPRRKPTQDSTNSRLMRQETYHGSTTTIQDILEPSQGFNTEHELSEYEFNGTYLSASSQRNKANRSTELDVYASSSRFSPEGEKSPFMKTVSAEEEELMYLEFISAVTEDILSREHISDRFLDRVIDRHIDMNRHQLDVGKMRHLLEILRKDFEEPTNTPTSSTEFEKTENALFDSFRPILESGGKQLKTKKDSKLFQYSSIIEYCDSPDFAVPLSVSTPLFSPETISASPFKVDEEERVDDHDHEKSIGTLWLREKLPGNIGIGENNHQNQDGTTETNEGVNHENNTVTSQEGIHQEQAGVSQDGQSEELEELGRSLSLSLHVSSNEHSNNVETPPDQHPDTVASASDEDEF